jgi:hypothetical protein
MPLPPVPSRRPDQDELLIVSFYTDDAIYAPAARRLAASCRALGLDHDIRGIDPAAGWVETCAKKARYCLQQMKEHRRPLVWVDADAIIRRPPDLLRRTGADFAVYHFEDRLFLSGTLYFAPTEPAMALLRAWTDRCAADPTTFDQVHLQEAWRALTETGTALKTLFLPPAYTKIYDRGHVDPVIEHFQASRQSATLKPPGDASADDVDAFRRARDDALHRLGRTRDALVAHVAARCAELGYRRIVLFGAGRHTTPYVRHPWCDHGITVVAIADDHPTRSSLGGVAVLQPIHIDADFDAIVISSDDAESTLADRARAVWGADVPITRLYAGAALPDDSDEFALRRIELLEPLAMDRTVGLIGSWPEAARSLLPCATSTTIHGTIADLGHHADAFDLLALFEPFDEALPVEHLQRALRPFGRMLLTVDARGAADEIASTMRRVESALRPVFPHVSWWGQRLGSEPRHADLPAGIYPLNATAPAPDVLLALAVADLPPAP